MPVFRSFKPPPSKTTGKTTSIPRTTKEPNIIVWNGIEFAPAKTKCKDCKPGICYKRVHGDYSCLGCSKGHKRCIRESTSTKKKPRKASSKTSGTQEIKPKVSRRVQQLEAVVITPLQTRRMKAKKKEAQEQEEEPLDLSWATQDLEATFKKSEAKIQIMREQLEEAERLQKMNMEFLKKFPGREQPAGSGPSSAPFPSSRRKAKPSGEEDTSRSIRGGSSGGLEGVLLTLREVIDETLTRSAQEPSRKRTAKRKDDDVIDLT
ncbi:hypothetical protein AGABI2DRAFT_123487 [Agaricus bisporus var. bisporus H97]|uniref:hypothetical protein n=1 Tax=Agaricus bisporus var. bisporus (strain H97 / ATCC MYA-4626 / FGSC 10389) TaxID=936046 RepID=UPI00029F7C25|nr:hypothetical protein AGABI2DRAFT_123487 [Agaricus bisporus var. bisporus H97]EKV41637.1 hypothetical protein AGABI2DRAFT_123487 [Agaricus bisporus var. bisporus H97]